MDWACNSCKQLHLLSSAGTITDGIDSMVGVSISGHTGVAVKILSRNVQFPE